MTKRRKGSKKSAANGTFKSAVKLIGWGVALVLCAGILLGAGYYLGYVAGSQQEAAGYSQERESLHEKITRLERQLREAPSLSKKLQGLLERDGGKYTATHEYEATPAMKEPPEGPKRETHKVTRLPKLAIIIDDVAFAHDVRAIADVGLPLTMSFLPPSSRHPDSAALAANVPYYMVHLPLEALNFRSEEPFTLRAGDTQETIYERVRQLKKIFPRVEYVNNHTGSAFTADEKAMNRLLFALRKEQIGFIDSRTTAQTKVPKVMKNYGLPYVARDVFLDHDSDPDAIKKEIKRAVAIAKKHGSAIAIGHPHKQTLKALKESTHLFDGVEVVRIDALL